MQNLPTLIFLCLLIFPTLAGSARADALADNPILFVTAVPNPADFGTMAATFGNHLPNPTTAYRGGDLWIRYPDGALKNLTAAAGYGNAGMQGANAIAVRDPSVHWDGAKAIFSMLVGAPTQQYQLTSQRWQLYEITGLGSQETPVITKVANQPQSYNNHSPIYTSDDSILFVSDRPRDDTVLHTYPQRDEYESSPVNSGLWKLNPTTGALVILDHSPSGNFNPIIDSFGRVIFTRWDHLQRDQQNVGVSFGAFNFESETSSTASSSAAELFPEPRSTLDPEYRSSTNLFTLNQFFPWMMNQDGTDLETLNHVGRQEIGVYSERSFNDDPNLQEFYGQYSTGANQNEFTIFLHIKELPNTPGTYLGVNCQEFGTHSGGQIVSISGAPGVNPDAMQVGYLTHPETSGASDAPSANHSGLYRDPLPLANGNLLASHSSTTLQDSNIGSGAAPQSRYAFRIVQLTKPGAYYVNGTPLTTGISKSISFWSPDILISYSGPLWELMPVELRARTRPSAGAPTLPAPEALVLSQQGVALADLQHYLRSNNLALIVSRNLTTRDKNDRQQPTNLRVTGGSTQSLPNAGKIYDISFLEIFQGDLIRGYQSSSSSGRRVLAQRMHSLNAGTNPLVAGAPAGAVQIAEDGSMAAFVPARRALTWQLSASDSTPVVRERYWLTFQPGEIRVCASCHGVNTADHLGQPAPTNPPLALARLLAHWKNLPMPEPTASPDPGEEDPSQYSLSITAEPSAVAGGAFEVVAEGGTSEERLILRAALNGKRCVGAKPFASDATTRSLEGTFPKLSKARLRFTLYARGGKKALAAASVRLPKEKGSRSRFARRDCKALLGSLR